MKIIYENTDKINIIEKTDTSFFNCEIYIPTSFNFDIIFFCIDGELVEFKKGVSAKPLYNVYKPSYSSLINLKNGFHTISLKGVYIPSKSIVEFQNIDIDINFNGYNDYVRLYYSSVIGEDIANKYNKIIQLTNLCIQIYDAINTVKKEGE